MVAEIWLGGDSVLFPKLAIGLALGEKNKPTEAVGGFSALGGVLACPPRAHLCQRLFATPSVQGETFWVLKLVGQEEEKPILLWLMLQLEQFRDKSIIQSYACKGQETIIRKGDNTGFSLGKRKVSCKAKLLSLLWRLHGTPLLGCGLSPPIETCLFQSSVGFWEVL